MLVRAVPILDKGGGIREWIGVHTDIDAERRAEAALREAEERARLLLESSGEGIYGDRHARPLHLHQPGGRGDARLPGPTTCSARTSTR